MQRSPCWADVLMVYVVYRVLYSLSRKLVRAFHGLDRHFASVRAVAALQQRLAGDHATRSMRHFSPQVHTASGESASSQWSMLFMKQAIMTVLPGDLK
jgi:hypothetical protein